MLSCRLVDLKEFYAEDNPPWTTGQFFAADRTGQCAQKGRPSNRPDGPDA